MAGWVLLASFGCGGEEATTEEEPRETTSEIGDPVSQEAEPETSQEEEPDPEPALPERAEGTAPAVREQVPVEEDFEASAASEITTENYEAELARIERELEAEGAAPHGH